LIAHFGSSGTYAYDLDGKLLWQVDLGDMTTRRGFGEGSSPALHGDTVVINWDHEGDSFIVALDADTGKQRWKVERPGEITSWSTPLVVEHGGKPQVVVSATGKSRGYDLATGQELWSVGGMTTNAIPSPVHQDGIVYLMSGFRGSMLQAVALDRARGELEGTEAVLWTLDRDTPYVPSPVLHGGQLYFLKVFSEIFTSVDAKTGSVLYTERLPGIDKVYASPVAAAGRVYVFDRTGHGTVVEHGPAFRVVAENTLAEGADASPAIVGDEIFLRTEQHLYCISEAPAAEPAKASAARPAGTEAP
jgi:outer membrane protein assembly factor BamB